GTRSAAIGRNSKRGPAALSFHRTCWPISIDLTKCFYCENRRRIRTVVPGDARSLAVRLLDIRAESIRSHPREPASRPLSARLRAGVLGGRSHAAARGTL